METPTFYKNNNWDCQLDIHSAGRCYLKNIKINNHKIFITFWPDDSKGEIVLYTYVMKMVVARKVSFYIDFFRYTKSDTIKKFIKEFITQPVKI